MTSFPRSVSDYSRHRLLSGVKRMKITVLPHRWHTLDMECKGVFSIGIKRLLVGNRVGVGLTRSTIRPFLPSLFPVKGASKLRQLGSSEPRVARSGKLPWLQPRWQILPTKIGYCSNTNCAHRFRCEDNNVNCMHGQPHYYCVRQVEPCHQLGLVSRRSSWANELLALHLTKNNNKNQIRPCTSGVDICM